MTTVLHILENLSPQILQSAADCIRANGVLAVATESSYALSAGVHQSEAIQRIVELKGDRQNKPIPVLVSSKAQVDEIVSIVPPVAALLMDRFWPGPLTMILPAASGLSVSLTGGTPTIGVRQPDQPQLLQILDTTGPLTGTSANRSGMIPATTAEEIMQEFGEGVSMILDSGPSPGGSPSTVLNLVGEIQLVRSGPIIVQTLQEVLTPLGLRIQNPSL